MTKRCTLCASFVAFVFLHCLSVEAQSQPQLFANHIISTETGYETHPCFSPSGDTVYFLKCAPDLSASSIYVSYNKKGEWSAPSQVIFSGKYFDADPFVTKDGNTIYFTSNRPVKDGDSIRPDTDIWKVERNNLSWSKPVHLGPVINSSMSEHYPTLADNGNLYFGSERAGGKGGSDIYCAKNSSGKFNTPLALGTTVNSAGNEYEPFIAPDESYMIFMSTRPDGLSHADFYISYNEQAQWSPAVKLRNPINSETTEWAPKVTRDGQFFFFGSTRSRVPLQESNGLSDIYYFPAKELPLKRNRY